MLTGSGVNKRLNLLIISTPNPTKKAGTVAYDLLKLFRHRGFKVKLLVRYWDLFSDTDIITAETFFQAIIRFIRLKFLSIMRILFSMNSKNSTNRDYYFFDYDQKSSYFSKNKRIFKKLDKYYDAIIVIFYYDFMNLKDFYELYIRNNKSPILLYMMDMAPLTGGCHYAWDCIGYTKNCGFCPALYSKKENDQSRINFEFNQKFINNMNIIPIAATELQYTQLLRSNLYKQKNKYKVLLGIDDKLFKPGDKLLARKKLNLPVNKKIIFYGAIYLEEKRKGLKYFLESLELINESINGNKLENIQIVIAGSSNNKIKEYNGISVAYLGNLSIDRLPLVFQASDIFVSTSIEDSGPMMINQSIMCGTPVVAFEMGVALDLVITGQNGYRAKLKDSNDLANGIMYLLNISEEEYENLSMNCRKLGHSLLQPKIQIDSILKILESHKL